MLIGESETLIYGFVALNLWTFWSGTAALIPIAGNLSATLAGDYEEGEGI